MRRCPATWLVLAAIGCAEPGPARAPGPRVVSLHDVTTEMVVALGAVDRLVGVAEPVDPSAEVRAAIAAVPVVGGLESIVSAHPDVVLGLGVVAERDPELVDRLRRGGVDVLLADPADASDVADLVRAVAARVGAAGAGEDLASRFLAGAAPRPARPGHRPRVFVYDCCDPPFTAGGKTVLTDLIARAGGENVFADLPADWTHVSWEEVVARRPELVVIHAYRYEGQGDAADKQRAIRRIPPLGGLPSAVVPLGCSLGGLRSLEGIDRLAAAIEALP